MLNSIYEGTKSRNGDGKAFEDWIKDSDLDTLLESLCHGSKGSIAYDDFLSFALDTSESDDMIDLHSKMHKEVFKRSKLRLKDLIKLFSLSKSFAEGYVRNGEFDKIVKKMYTKISSKEIEMLVDYWDRDKEGTVDYYSFCVWLHTGNLPDEVYSYIYM